MNFKFVHKSRSVVYSWIASYMFIILILVILTGCVFFIAKNTIEDEINNSNKYVLEGIRDRLDNTFREIKKFSVEISLNENIQDAYRMTLLDHTSYYTLYKAANELVNYKFLDGSVISYYIYLNNIKMVLSPGVVNNSEYYYNGYLSTKSYSMTQWINTVSRKYNGDYMVMPYHQDVYGDSKGVVFIRSLPIPAFGNISANLVVTLDFGNMLNNISNDRSILILNSKNEIMAQSDTNINYSGIDYSEMNSSNGVLTRKTGGKEMVISYITSKENNWKYITATPVAVFWKKAEFIRYIMISGLTLCILLGVFMSYCFIKRNYNPLKEVVSYLQLKLKFENVWDSNEFNFIRKALNSTIEKKDEIQLKLDRQNQTLKTNFIISLLRGKSIAAPVYELMTNYDITFRHDNFSVVAIYIESIDESFWKSGKGENIDHYGMAKFIIMNVAGEIICRRNTAYVVEVDDILACLVNTGMEEDEFKEKIAEDITEARNFISQNFKINLMFSISGLCEGIAHIREAFEEAVNAMEYARLMGREDLVFYSDIAAEAGINFYYPVKKEHRLLNCIKSADLKEANSVIEDMFKNDLIKNAASMEITRFLMLNLIGTVLKTFNESTDDGDIKLINRINPAEQLMKCKTLPDMKDIMLKIIKSICDYKMNCHEQSDYKIRDTVKQIVAENYSKPNFGIGSIAAGIGKSPYYISKIFKDQTGEGILDYINGIRIKKAKELLVSGRLNQDQIAERTGFTNVRTFQRVFKKLEGITPGKLKNE